jgi:hypothetical protein
LTLAFVVAKNAATRQQDSDRCFEIKYCFRLFTFL